MVVQLKGQLRLLESKYQQALGQKDVLIARRRRAQAQQQVSKTISGMPKMDATAELDEWSGRSGAKKPTRRPWPKLGTDYHSTSQFAELETDAGVEDEWPRSGPK